MIEYKQQNDIITTPTKKLYFGEFPYKLVVVYEYYKLKERKSFYKELFSGVEKKEFRHITHYDHKYSPRPGDCWSGKNSSYLSLPPMRLTNSLGEEVSAFEVCNSKLLNTVGTYKSSIYSKTLESHNLFKERINHADCHGTILAESIPDSGTLDLLLDKDTKVELVKRLPLGKYKYSVTMSLKDPWHHQTIKASFYQLLRSFLVNNPKTTTCTNKATRMSIKIGGSSLGSFNRSTIKIADGETLTLLLMTLPTDFKAIITHYMIKENI
jgi:hypothetical protein